jgi:alpha-glucosidase (family GH31 glycosyl hydrolase)
VDQTPVFVRDGAIVPEQPADLASSKATPPGRLVVNVYGAGNGKFDLYEDDGISVDYERHRYALTPMRYERGTDGVHRIVIGPTTGAFDGQVQRRSYEVRIHGIAKPGRLSVEGKPAKGWTWNGADGTASATVPARDIRDQIVVEWRHP